MEEGNKMKRTEIASETRHATKHLPAHFNSAARIFSRISSLSDSVLSGNQFPLEVGSGRRSGEIKINAPTIQNGGNTCVNLRKSN
ncbi:hypothetical protein WG66_010210 [Moniliophthora roreri]|nr:hypothetical protein WG66_010210 [Moniliophthora roreri]